jgi:hypothetical protein
MATATQLSPFEACIYDLRVKYGAAADGDGASACGPRKFVETVLEHADLVRDGGSPRRVAALRAGTLPLAVVAEKSPDPWSEVRVLFVRAFQSMRSKTELRRFVIAIGDGRLCETPVNLARIDPAWCNEEHMLFMHCWGRVSGSAQGDEAKKAKGELCLGRAMVNHLTAAAGLAKSKAMQKAVGPIVERVRSHEPTLQLIGRLARFMRTSNTTALFNDAMAHAKALAGSGEVDMARIVREGIRLAQKNGVDPAEGVAQVSGLLDKYGGMVAAMQGAQK